MKPIIGYSVGHTFSKSLIELDISRPKTDGKVRHSVTTNSFPKKLGLEDDRSSHELVKKGSYLLQTAAIDELIWTKLPLKPLH